MFPDLVLQLASQGELQAEKYMRIHNSFINKDLWILDSGNMVRDPMLRRPARLILRRFLN